MPPAAEPRPARHPIRIALLLTVLAALLAAGVADARPTARTVVRTAPNAALNRTVLTNLKGHTLYSLSVETAGRFVCTGTCLALWHPLVLPSNVKPRGPVRLGTIRRPDGRTQVTYKGRPLYAFVGDTKAGTAKGEGAKDVGTWHAAVTPKSVPPPEPEPQPEPNYPY
jgi:predicted lipoprotein with Yx(FWY)xxD motif